MLPFNHNQKDLIENKQREMLRHAEEERLANQVVRSGWSFRQALAEAIALLAFQPTNVRPVQSRPVHRPSKLATDSGIHRIR